MYKIVQDRLKVLLESNSRPYFKRILTKQGKNFFGVQVIDSTKDTLTVKEKSEEEYVINIVDIKLIQISMEDITPFEQSIVDLSEKMDFWTTNEYSQLKNYAYLEAMETICKALGTDVHEVAYYLDIRITKDDDY